jgi:hypothetical protein
MKSRCKFVQKSQLDSSSTRVSVPAFLSHKVKFARTLRQSLCILFSITSSMVSAARLPELDARSSCVGLTETEGGASPLTMAECVENEQLARKVLEEMANSAADELVKQCVKSALETPPGSYLVILGCVKLAMSVGDQTTANKPPQALPEVKSDEHSSPPSGPALLGANLPEPSQATTAQPLKATTAPTVFRFEHDLDRGSVDSDVKQLQTFLNAHGFPVAASGDGSSGHEVETFGPSTAAALKKFQKAHAKELRITEPSGRFGPSTRKYINGD